MAEASLSKPATGVGLRECGVMPQMSLPVYWDAKYSIDEKSHAGPTDVNTIIGGLNDPKESGDGNHSEETDTQENEVTVDEAKDEKTNEEDDTETTDKETDEKGKADENDEDKNVVDEAINDKTNEGDNTGPDASTKDEETDKSDEADDNDQDKDVTNTEKKIFPPPPTIRTRTLTTRNKDTDEFGFLDPADGTFRVSLYDLAQQARVVLVAFYYADAPQSSILVNGLERIVQQVNTEYLKDLNLDPDASPPPVSAVVMNNKFPFACDNLTGGDKEQEECLQNEETVKESNWQGQLNNKFPMLQDTATVNAWEDVFGVGYYADLILYLDGKLYTYLPSSLTLSHDMAPILQNKLYDTNSIIAEDTAMLKKILMEALNYDGIWCQQKYVDNSATKDTGNVPPQSAQNEEIDNSESNQEEVPIVVAAGFGQDGKITIPGESIVNKYIDEDSLFYDVALGFIFAAMLTAAIVIGCMLWKCCCAVTAMWCCPNTLHAGRRRRRKPTGDDGRGMFKPLTQYVDGESEGDSESEEDADLRNEYGETSEDEEEINYYRKDANAMLKKADDYFRKQEDLRGDDLIQLRSGSNESDGDSDSSSDSEYERVAAKLNIELPQRKSSPAPEDGQFV